MSRLTHRSLWLARILSFQPFTLGVLWFVNTIDFYVSEGYFSEGVARPSGEKLVPKSKIGEAVVFRDFFTAGLRFPCDKMLP